MHVLRIFSEKVAEDIFDGRCWPKRFSKSMVIFNVLIIRFVEWFHCDILGGVFES